MKLSYKINTNIYSNVKDVLKSYFKISDRLLTKLKKNQKIFLNNKNTYINAQIKLNDLIEIDLNFDEVSENIVPIKMNLNIVYEDESLLILNKSSNLPVHPSILHYDNSLSNGVQYHLKMKNIKTKIRPVNRLDKDTSGIVIFAKNEYIQEMLIKQMKSRDFKKEYLAILTGFLDKKSGTISAPILRKADSIIEREVNNKGDIAITNFKLIKNFEYKNKKLSFVKFEIETGRTHQIRVHTKYIGHPILGDTLYGNTTNLINRQALHAYRVSFIHPITQKKCVFETTLPIDMKKILKI